MEYLWDIYGISMGYIYINIYMELVEFCEQTPGFELLLLLPISLEPGLTGPFLRITYSFRRVEMSPP
jgi:hypothetical protein